MTTPGPRTVAIDAPTELAPGHANTVTTTLAAGGNQTLHSVTLALNTPQGWEPVTQSTFDTVPPGTQLHTTWAVTPPASAQTRLWHLTASATGQQGFEVTGAKQVSTAPLVQAQLTSTTTPVHREQSFDATLSLRNTSDLSATANPALTPAAGVTVTSAPATVALAPHGTATATVHIALSDTATAATVELTGTVVQGRRPTR